MPDRIPWPRASFRALLPRMPWPHFQAGVASSEPVQDRPGSIPGARQLAGLRRPVGGIGGATQATQGLADQSTRTQALARADLAGNLPGLGRRPAYTFLGPAYTAAGIAPQGSWGPLPKFAPGTGRTGRPAAPGMSAQFPAHVSDQKGTYEPQGYEYAPPTNFNRTWWPPRVGEGAVNGRDLVGTYEPHDMVIGTYTTAHWEASGMWEMLGFPPSFRDLIKSQAVQKYNLATAVSMARPMQANDYFLGYRTSDRVAAQLGGSAFQPLGQGGA